MANGSKAGLHFAPSLKNLDSNKSSYQKFVFDNQEHSELQMHKNHQNAHCFAIKNCVLDGGAIKLLFASFYILICNLIARDNLLSIVRVRGKLA